MGCLNVRRSGVIVAIGRSLFAAVLLLCVAGKMPITAQAGPPTAAEVKAARMKAANTLKASKEATEAARAHMAKTAEDMANKDVEMATADKEAKVEAAKAAATEAGKHPKDEAKKEAANAAADAVVDAEQMELDAKATLAELMADHAAHDAKAIMANISSPKAKAPVFPGGAGAAAAAAAASPTLEANRIHVIIAAHTGPLTVANTVNGIAAGAAANANRMTRLLRNEAKGKASITSFVGNQFTHSNITTTIANLPSGPNDTIFLYIACHGGTDTVSRQQFLQVPGGINVARTTYLNALKAKISNNTARQVVMVTDSCSNAFPANIPVVPLSAAAAAAGMVQTHALSRLLLHQTGVYDFGGSLTPSDVPPNGELGVYYPSGGLFTNAFYNAARYAPLDQGWNSLFASSASDLDRQVIFNFGTSRVINIAPHPTQIGQHPKAFPVFP